MVCPSASRISMAKYTAECSPSSPYTYLEWSKMFGLVAVASVSDCVAMNARSEAIAVAIPSFWTVTVSVVAKRMWYEPNFQDRNFE